MSKKTIRAFFGHECQMEVHEFDTDGEVAAFRKGVEACDGWMSNYLTDDVGQTYIVQEETICDGWINNWTEASDPGEMEPQTFDSYAKAEDELVEFLQEVEDAVERGDMSHPYDRESYRIIPIDLEN